MIALPLTADTRGIIADVQLSQFRGARVIMIGRGATVDFEALHRAIESGAVHHATIDVFPREPLPDDSWVWQNPHVTMTPHISGLVRPLDSVTSFLNARAALLQGVTPRGLVKQPMG